MDVERLKRIDLFEDLPAEQLEKLAGVVNAWSKERGETLIKRGDSSFQLFAIEYGAVEVCSKEEMLATLGVGQVVGEIGVAKRGLRKASVEATQAAGGFFLTNSQVEMVRREAPDFEQKLQSLVERRGF
ncbi:MAG: cyclic nucleotide-binding domain-containing protein [Thermoleophilaceae bacterium]